MCVLIIWESSRTAFNRLLTESTIAFCLTIYDVHSWQLKTKTIVGIFKFKYLKSNDKNIVFFSIKSVILSTTVKNKLILFFYSAGELSKYHHLLLFVFVVSLHNVALIRICHFPYRGLLSYCQCFIRKFPTQAVSKWWYFDKSPPEWNKQANLSSIFFYCNKFDSNYLP